MSDNEGVTPCIELHQGYPQRCTELDSNIEEADSRIIPHIEKAIMRGVQKVIVLSNDTDVFVLVLYYVHYFMEKGLVEIWMKYGTGEGERLIPMYILGNIIKPKLCKIILKAHILTGCDVTSKVGTKLAALNSEPELYLESFG